MKNKLKTRLHDRGGQTNAGELQIGDRIIFKADVSVARALAMAQGQTDPIYGTIINRYADNAYAVQPDGITSSYYVHGESVELSGQPRRCARPACSQDAANDLCESHERQQAELADRHRSQISERIKKGEEVRSSAASKAWETRRRRQDGEEA